jgi:hypothetical protein
MVGRSLRWHSGWSIVSLIDRLLRPPCRSAARLFDIFFTPRQPPPAYARRASRTAEDNQDIFAHSKNTLTNNGAASPSSCLTTCHRSSPRAARRRDVVDSTNWFVMFLSAGHHIQYPIPNQTFFSGTCSGHRARDLGDPITSKLASRAPLRCAKSRPSFGREFQAFCLGQ